MNLYRCEIHGGFFELTYKEYQWNNDGYITGEKIERVPIFSDRVRLLGRKTRNKFDQQKNEIREKTIEEILKEAEELGANVIAVNNRKGIYSLMYIDNIPETTKTF